MQDRTPRRRGAGAAETGLVIGLVTLVATAALTSFGESTSDLVTSVSNDIAASASFAEVPDETGETDETQRSWSSCRTILADGASTGDGVYTIDPDGEGGAAPFDVYCDMTTDGGGWLKTEAVDASGDGVFVGYPGNPISKCQTQPAAHFDQISTTPNQGDGILESTDSGTSSAARASIDWRNPATGGLFSDAQLEALRGRMDVLSQTTPYRLYSCDDDSYHNNNDHVLFDADGNQFDLGPAHTASSNEAIIFDWHSGGGSATAEAGSTIQRTESTADYQAGLPAAFVLPSGITEIYTQCDNCGSGVSGHATGYALIQESTIEGGTFSDSASGGGETQTFVGTTCASILSENPGANDGVYSLDLNDDGNFFDVYCDMTTDGGGWLKLAPVDNNDDRVFAHGSNNDYDNLDGWYGSAVVSSYSGDEMNTTLTYTTPGAGSLTSAQLSEIRGAVDTLAPSVVMRTGNVDSDCYDDNHAVTLDNTFDATPGASSERDDYSPAIWDWHTNSALTTTRAYHYGTQTPNALPAANLLPTRVNYSASKTGRISSCYDTGGTGTAGAAAWGYVGADGHALVK